ncbi:DUF3040 domain-containing protein [Salinactinospora qingdaonensis]|uniref:DUF3040 domain-containing protein n=1 Tax=Salinactinospora qingdaonensis TaxID=702744 RepID=A0ABP7FJD1_9ACTN
MSSSPEEDRQLREIERALATDDPDLARRLAFFNVSGAPPREPVSRGAVAAIVIGIVLAALILITTTYLGVGAATASQTASVATVAAATVPSPVRTRAAPHPRPHVPPRLGAMPSAAGHT